MTTFCLTVVCVLAWAQDEDKNRNRFQELNPGYRERAGASYEKQYLPGAATSLWRAVKLERFTEEEAAKSLRRFIYDWLDAYVEGGGAMSRSAHAGVLKRADDRMRQSFDDESAFKRWIAWRSEPTGRDNPLAFIMHPDFAVGLPVQLSLPGDLKEAGWTMESLEDEKLAAHKHGFSGAPSQVVIVPFRCDLAGGSPIPRAGRRRARG